MHIQFSESFDIIIACADPGNHGDTKTVRMDVCVALLFNSGHVWGDPPYKRSKYKVCPSCSTVNISCFAHNNKPQQN